MQLVVVTPPQPVVTIEDARAHLRRDDGDDDVVITGVVAAATAALDGPDGWLNRALGRQQIEARLGADVQPGWHHFWHHYAGEIPLPCGPLVSVDSVGYLDQAGAPQTLDDAQYRVFGVDTVRGSLRLTPDLPWAEMMRGPETIRIRYTAGYTSIPAPIRAAILMMVSDLYENRDGKVQANLVENPSVQALLAPFRVWA